MYIIADRSIWTANMYKKLAAGLQDPPRIVIAMILYITTPDS